MGNEKEVNESSDLKNIIILSIGFMLTIGAWRTTAAIEQTVLKSVQIDDPSFTGDGYLSQAIINGVFSVTTFVAPTILSFVGLRTTLVLGTCFYTIFIANFLYPNSLLLYGCSGLIGFGAANVWIAYGTYITRCSTKETIGKYIGMSWAIVSLGVLLGNGFVFYKFQGIAHIDKDTRFFVSSTLTGVAILASITLAFLGKRRGQKTLKTESDGNKKSHAVFVSMTRPFRLLGNKHLLLIIPAAMYNGLELAFMLGVYPASVAFSEALGGDTKKLVGVAGMLSGVGSITGGLLFGFLLTKYMKPKRTVIVKFAFFGHCSACALIYLNLPNAASLGPTLDTSWIEQPSVIIALLCAFLLGVADACLGTQISAAIGVIWSEDPSSALAIYRFSQAVAGALGLFIGTLVGLHVLILVIFTMTVIGTLTFHANEALVAKLEKKEESSPVEVEDICVISKRKLSVGLTEMGQEDKSHRSLD